MSHTEQFTLRIETDAEAMARVLNSGRFDHAPAMKQAFARTYRHCLDNSGVIVVDHRRKDGFGRYHPYVRGSAGVVNYERWNYEDEFNCPNAYLLPPPLWPRDVKAYIYSGRAIDADMSVCHQSLFVALCKKYDVSCPVCIEFIEHRDDRFVPPVARVKEFSVLSFDDNKNLYIRLGYGGELKNWEAYIRKPLINRKTGEVIRPSIILPRKFQYPSCVTDYTSEMQRAFDELVAKLPLDLVNRLLVRKGKTTNINAKIVSSLIQHLEAEITLKCQRHSERVDGRIIMNEWDGLYLDVATQMTMGRLQDITVDIGHELGYDFSMVRWKNKPLASSNTDWDQLESVYDHSESDLPVGPDDTMAITRMTRWLQVKPYGATHDSMTDIYLNYFHDVAYDGFNAYKIDDFGMYKMFPSLNDAYAYISTCMVNKVVELGNSYCDQSFMQRLHQLSIDSYDFKRKCAMNTLDRIIDSDLRDRLDSDPKLWGFNNGVLHIDEAMAALRQGVPVEVRKAKPDEYVSFTTNYDFEYISKDSDRYKSFSNIIRACFALNDKDTEGIDTYEKFQTQVGSGLVAGNPCQRAVFMEGVGANGKTMIIKMLQSATGDYHVVVDGSWWAQSPVSGDKPAPMVVKMIKKRYYITSELDDDGKINSVNFRSVVGNDSRECRDLFAKSKQMMICHFIAFVLFAMNDPPMFSGKSAHAVTRRLRVTPLNILFSNNPDHLELPNRKAADERLTDERYLQQFRNEIFMWLLLGRMAFENNNGQWIESAQQINATKELHSKIDTVAPWAAEWIVLGDPEKDFLLTESLHASYNAEVGEDHKLDKKEFGEKFIKVAKLRGYKKADNPRFGFDLDEYNQPKLGAIGGKPMKKKGAGYIGLKLKTKERPAENPMFVKE